MNGGRTEFTHRERHRTEETARVILNGSHAFLIGNAVFNRIDEILCGTLNSYNGKETEGYKKGVCLPFVYQITVYLRIYAVGNLVYCTAALAAATMRGLNYLCAEDNGIHGFEDSNRQIGGAGLMAADAAGTEAVCLGFALEYADIAFASEEDHFLFHNSHTVKLPHIAGADAGFKYDFYVDFNAELIKSAVKGNIVDVDIGPQHLCVLGSDNRCPFDDFLTAAGQIYFYVLIAVLVTAGIENTVGVDADHVSFPVLTERISVISHFLFHTFLKVVLRDVMLMRQLILHQHGMLCG